MSEIVNVPMHEQRDIRTVTVEIRQLHRQGQEMALRYIVEIGRRLREAKEMLEHGEWGQWVKDELPFSQSTAGNFMRIFEEYGADQTSLFGAVKSQALANLSYTKALRLLAIEDEGEREAFVEAHDVDAMSTRELEQAIRERDEARRRVAELEISGGNAAMEIDELKAKLADVPQLIGEAAKELEDKLKDAEERLKKAEGDRGSAFREKQELQKQADDLRAKLKVAQDAEAKARENAKKARDELKALKGKPAEVPAEELEKLRSAAEKEATEKTAAAVKEAEARAEELRLQLAQADPDTAVFKELFTAVQTDFNRMGALVQRIRERDAGKADKLKAAVVAVLGRFDEQVERW